METRKHTDVPNSAGSDTKQKCANSDGVEYAFGNYVDTGDWIESVSLRHPEKTYYYNMNSRCSTWLRPVPPEVKLPRAEKRPDLQLIKNVKIRSLIKPYNAIDTVKLGYCISVQRIFNNNSETDSYVDYTLMTISSDSETDSESTKRKRLRTLMRIYHDSMTNFNNNNVDDDLKSVEWCGGNESDVDLHNFLIESNNIIEKQICDDLHLATAVSDFLDVDINLSKSDSEIPEVREVEQYGFDNAFRSPERSEQSTSEEDEYITYNTPFSSDKNVDARTHARNIFRLPSITPDCLIRYKNEIIKEMPKKEKKKRLITRKSKSVTTRITEPRPIICDMYGTTTINYNCDFVEPLEQRKLPPGVSISQLSESSVTSSAWQDENKAINFNNMKIPNVNLNLSSPSSSSSSSSSCSTCNTNYSCSSSSSSDTESSSSTSTENSKKKN